MIIHKGFQVKSLFLIILSVCIFLIFTSCGDVSDIPVSPMAFIPAGDFIRGSDTGEPDETPESVSYLGRYYIDIYEVSNSQYKYFVERAGHAAPENWVDGEYEEGKGDHPVVSVSWNDANEYCRWVAKRLPTEDEWEKAARGPNGNEYPWGDMEPNFDLANYGSFFNIGRTTPVSDYSDGISYYGVYNMAGNVWEWTSDWFNLYEGNTSNSASNYDNTFKIIKGGAFNRVDTTYLRSSARIGQKPDNSAVSLGFRCAKR